MRKFFGVLVLSVLLVGCNLQLSTQLHPPSWIIGKWGDTTVNYEFTSDNVVLTAGTSVENYKEKNLPVTETITSTKYAFSYSLFSITYYTEFNKVSDSVITYSTTVNGTKVGPIAITKV